MADYDTKSIPILDDIIESHTTENTADDGASEDLAAEATLAESNLDLFFDESGDIISEDSDPQIGVIDDIDEDQDNNAQQIDFAATEFSIQDQAISYETEVEIDIAEEESETIESALIDYHNDPEDVNTDFAVHLYPVIDTIDEFETEVTSSDLDQITFIEPSVDEATEVPADIPDVTPGETAGETFTLESVVDDIVKQLMPDLELQLRFLVQQALEDRLSDEMLDHLTTRNNKL
jgi:hypothetical protein